MTNVIGQPGYATLRLDDGRTLAGKVVVSDFFAGSLVDMSFGSFYEEAGLVDMKIWYLKVRGAGDLEVTKPDATDDMKKYGFLVDAQESLCSFLRDDHDVLVEKAMNLLSLARIHMEEALESMEGD